VIPVPTGVRVWLATGHTDMRRGFPSLSLQVQEVLRQDPLSGHLFCFRGRRGDLLKVIWPSERLSLTLNVRSTARARACSPNVWRKAVFFGRARPMGRYRSRRRNLAICFPGSTGAIPRKPGVQRRSADGLPLKTPANYDSLAG
jgi:transposase